VNMFTNKNWVLGVILFSLIGCGKNSGEVTGTCSGKLTLDGKPAAAGCVVVCQHVKRGLSAGAKVEPDGSFQILMQDGPSLIAGDYKVLIQPPDFKMSHEEAMKLAQANKFPKLDDSVVPSKYRSYETSKLFMIVNAGKNTFDIPMVTK
jgi:hypothetical protein